MTGSKQFLVWALVAGLTLGFAACGGQKADAPEAETESATEVDEQEIAGDDFESGDTSGWDSRSPADDAGAGDDATEESEEGDGEGAQEEDPGA